MKSSTIIIYLMLTCYSLSSFSDNPNFQKNEKAQDFIVKTIEDQEVALSDFKGKVVYISFWASWCEPCISGFNKYEEMRRSIQDLGVVILNVSIDKKEEAWQMGLQNIPQVGIQAFAMKERSALIHNYELSSIPSYYIVDKKGNFAYLTDDPQRDIIKEFRAFVNQ